jgi:enterochelin esterase-like enzyme
MHRTLTILLVCALSVTLPAQAQGVACAALHGEVTEYAFDSQLTGQRVRYALYTPPCFDAPERADWRYPILYLLHGSDATGTDYWLKLGLAEALDAGIRDGTLPPMLVVLPFGGDLANLNEFGARSFANVLLKELLPIVEPTFRADGQRATRAIGGISRGGFWAFHLAFLYPGVFSAVGGHSAFFSLSHAPAANPLVLAQRASDLDTLYIWLDHGRDDYAAPNIALLSRRLSARGIAHQYVVYPEGRHEAAYWRAHVRDYLAFYGAAWRDFQHVRQ